MDYWSERQYMRKNKIAIIGVSCRFPGNINSLDDYWNVLATGQDVVTEVPDSRWDKTIYGHPMPKTKGRSYIWSAGILENIDQFDADFFGISRREIEQVDPQQRLLLELVWEAFESGGLKPKDYRGTKSGVYIGVGSNDYSIRRIDDLESMNSYSMTGNTASICSNRISYIFDFHGPSFSIDTACSSSLVAIHQACLSLKSGESTLAIAGGVNMLLHPMGFIGFSQASMLSPSGRCKAFDASGDGYVRSEGAGIVILKPLEEALKDGNKIFAIINASGINADGKKNGISLPNIAAQTELLNTIYKDFNVDNLVYVEAHGTGTVVGDPIEAGAIANAVAKRRKHDHPLFIGSAKTNLGHLEVASGMAGLLKAILCLKHRAIPANLHYKTPNPNIPFEEWNLKITDQYTAIQPSQEPIFIGVNSFGFGGANAHVLLEEYRDSSNQQTSEDIVPPLIISANNEDGLNKLAEQMFELIYSHQYNYYDLAWSVFHHRDLHKECMAIYGSSVESIKNSLKSYVTDKQLNGITKITNTRRSKKIALIYSGNGSQWAGMGARLLQESNLFKQTIEEIDQLWQQLADFSILEELIKPVDNSRLELTEIAQPLLFAIQVGISRILIDMGISVSATAGHSVGEVAAAWMSGALSLEQATKVIFERSYAQGKTKGSGKMAAVMLSKEKMNEYLENHALSLKIVVAGSNSPKSVTISGDFDSLLILKEILARDGVIFKILDLDYAFHSNHMDAIKDSVTQNLSELKPSKTTIDYISTVTGSQLSGKMLGEDYWWHNIRDEVKFSSAINCMIEQDIGLFIEVGPHSILTKYIEQCCNAKDAQSKIIATLQRNNDSIDLINNCFYSALLSQGDIDHSKLFPNKGNFVTLPTYPWSREKFWIQSVNQHALIERKTEFPLLGYKEGNNKFTWKNSLDTKLIPWLADHVVGESVVVPAAAYVDMALCAAQAVYNHDNLSFEDMEIYSPITLADQELKKITVSIAENQTFYIKSDNDEINNVTARIIENTSTCPHYSNSYSIETAEQIFTAKRHYQLAVQVGLEYGNYFQTIEKVWLWKQNNYAIAKLKLEESLTYNIGEHLLHPTLLDGCFQILLDVFSGRIESGDLRALIPIRIGKISFFKNENQPAWCAVEVISETERSGVANFTLFDENKRVIAQLYAVRFRSVSFINVKKDSYSKYVYQLKLAPINNFNSNVIDIAELQDFINKLGSIDKLQDRISFFQEVIPLTDALICSYYLKYVKTLINNHKQFSYQKLIGSNEVDKRYFPLISHIMQILEQNKLIEVNEDGFYNVIDTELPEADIIWQTIISEFPELLPELSILATLGESLSHVLGGHINPQLLFNPQKSSTLSHYYGGSKTFEWQNHTLLVLIQHLVTTNKQGTRLKILDLSNQHSELAKSLVPCLKEQPCDYILAHEDEDYISDTIAELDGFENFKAIQISPENFENEIIQKSQNNYFDIILINNNLRKSVNFSKTLKHIINLLKFNGKLIIGEENKNNFNSLFYGAEPDWWLKKSDDSYTPRLFNSSSWKQLLIDNGLKNIIIVEEQEDVLHQAPYIIITENNSPRVDSKLKETTTTSKTALIVTDENVLTQEIYQKIASLLPEFKFINLENASSYLKVTENHYKLDLSQENFINQVLEDISRFQIVIDIYGFINNLSSQTMLNNNLECRCINTLALVKALEPRITREQITLWIISNNGAVFNHTNGEDFNNPVDGALWGLGRVIMNEYPELETKLLDLRNFEPDAKLIAKTIAGEITNLDQETEIVHYPNARFVMRMRDNQLQSNCLNNATVHQNYELSFKVPGSLSNLYWKTKEYEQINPDEIRIKPYATGVNFRDVMYTMGMISDEAVENGYAGASLGMELSGIVEEVGKEVTAFEVGDEVVSFAPASFSNSVVTKTTATSLKPKEWSHEEAATIPTVFFTVYYALHHLAQLQPGEKILIHGAAGGIGLAALQYASHIGAEIYATAGTDEKRAFVKAMGANYVFDSRSLAFADKIMDITEGKGIDVVLNSLYGEAVWRSLAILKPFGRFLELGKRDFYANNKLGLRPFRNNISYFGIDADQLMIEKPKLAAKLFKEMMELFNSNIFRPLPFRTFPVNKIEYAFRYMQQSRQIGKVIVSMESLESSIETSHDFEISGKLELDNLATYLVTGGTSGFGLEAAKWLISRGAKNLLLISRSGIKDADSAQIIKDMQEQGNNIYIHNLDISDYSQLESFFKYANDNYPTIKGIIHAAAVINDAFIRDTSIELFNKVFKPKAYGAKNLHDLTKSIALDLFVVFSSMTTYIGNPGQANYVAANSYLEGLIHYRRKNGLNGTYVAFGAIDDAGFLTRNQAVKDSLMSKLGSDAIPATRALHEMEKIILQDIAGAAVVNLDWNNLKKYLPTAKSQKYEQQLIKASKLGTDHIDIDIKKMIMEMPREEAIDIIGKLLALEIGKILHMAPEKVDTNKPIFELGMDSLMGVELAMSVEQHFAFKLPLMALAEGATINKLTVFIYDKTCNHNQEDNEAQDIAQSLAAKHGVDITQDKLLSSVE